MLHGFKICTHLQGCWLPAVAVQQLSHLHMVQPDGLGVISHWIPSSSNASEKSRKYCNEILARMFLYHCYLLTPSHPLCSLTSPILPGLCHIAPLSSIWCNRIVIHSLIFHSWLQYGMQPTYLWRKNSTYSLHTDLSSFNLFTRVSKPWKLPISTF